ncbi:MAG: 5'/3'-nucleotidase SurE [Candidatus Kapabacteria bacterium]|nr:5'/3'-nucleotidase SurE [Ignavibacteriota bacterium]MCW5885734.1 5'/3'-nucleotidase SurE [Candidatus Kapabacteria bacterium]
MLKNKPLILVTNDDGINSPGIEVLKNSLLELGEVIIIAPDMQRSAVSSALTIHKPLRVRRFYKNGDFFGYSVDGNPADCVKLAVSTLLDRKPDLVVSGINHGKNTSINVLYSGTVAGATEGVLAGINSIAISHASHALNSDLVLSGKVSNILARILLNTMHRQKVLLNVNLPDLADREVKGIKLTRLSSSKWADKYERREDPFGNEYYWFAGVFMISEIDTATDDGAVENGFVSVSPISLNLYDNSRLDEDIFSELNDEFADFNRGLRGRYGTGGAGTE